MSNDLMGSANMAELDKQNAFQQGAQGGASEFSLGPVLSYLWGVLVRRRLLIFLITALVLAIGLIATMLTPLEYTARTQIEISREQKNVTNVEGVESASDARDVEFYATQYALLEAESLAERVVRKLDLTKSSEFYEAHGLEQMQLGDLPAAGSERLLAQRLEEQAVAVLLSNINIAPIRNSRLVDLLYNSGSPQISASVSNAWADEYIAASMDRQFASTADARKFLEERLEQLRARLEQSERDTVNYASEKDIVTLDTSSDASGRTVSQRTL